MKSITLQGTAREQVGKKETKLLRNEGNVPCVLCGGEETIHFYVDERALHPLLFTPDVFLVNIEIGGNTHQGVMQETQFHPVTDRALHVDFVAVHEDKPVSVALPVILTGTSPGVRAGGKLRLNSRKLKVKGLAAKLPDAVEVDISKLKIGQSVKLGTLQVEGLEFLESPNNVVVAVKTSRKAMMAADSEEEEEEAPAEA